MKRMGFTERWVQLMMVGVKTVSYSVLVNGEPKGMIKPTRGIRQGDPLSPFLFLLCTEGLHGLFSQVAGQGEIHGYLLCKNGPKLTHLFFADDSLLFCRSTPQECDKVLELLDTYSKYSGQHINKSKTTIFFSKSTTPERKQYIKNALGVPEIRSYEKYLGLPSLIGRRKKASFEYIKERVWKKLQGWGENCYLKPRGKCSLKPLFKPFPPTLCLASNFRWDYVMKLKALLENLGGDKEEIDVRSIG